MFFKGTLIVVEDCFAALKFYQDMFGLSLVQYNKWTKDLEKDWDYEKDVNKKYREDLTFTFGEFTSTESSTTATTTEK